MAAGAAKAHEELMLIGVSLLTTLKDEQDNDDDDDDDTVAIAAATVDNKRCIHVRVGATSSLISYVPFDEDEAAVKINDVKLSGRQRIPYNHDSMTERF